MILERFDRNRYTFPILLMVVWTAFGLFFGTQNYIRDVYTGEHPSLTGYLLGWLICGYSWAGLTPLLLRFLRHFSLERLGMSKFLLVHLSSGAVIASGQLAAYVAIASLIALLSGTPARSFVEWYPRLWMLEFRSSYLVYLVIAASVAAYSRVFRTAEKLRPEVQNAEPPASMNGHSANGHYSTRLAVKENGRIVLVDVGTIEWIQSYGNYLFLHTPSGRHMLRETMSNLEKKLDPADFVRIRRSAMIRAASILELRPEGNGEYEVRLSGGTSLASTRHYRKNLESLLSR